MTLLKFKNETPMQNAHVFPTMNDFFNEFFDGMITNDFKRWNTPAVNIVENEGQFTMQLAVPGMNKDDIKINVNDNTLTVSAEKKSESNENGQRYTRREFAFSSFSRSFKLPELVNVDAITANYENGIMYVKLPKLEEAKPKSREIKVS